MGFEAAELEAIGGHEDAQQRNERNVRTGEPQQSAQDYGTWALKPVDVYEAYCRIDADGDGLLELWKVIAAGTDKRVLRRIRVKSQPYVGINIRRSPAHHRGAQLRRPARRFAEGAHPADARAAREHRSRQLADAVRQRDGRIRPAPAVAAAEGHQ
jgi:hypothetical protein